MRKVYATEQGVKYIYEFISELLGVKQDRELVGMLAYQERSYLNDSSKNLHHNIWLERLYEELDGYYQATAVGAKWLWTTPIEIDGVASQLQITGALLNDRRLMTATNLIGDGNGDPWTIPGLPRNHVKKVCTPKLYGSNGSVRALWQKAKLPFDLKMVAIMNKELQQGMFGLSDAFKDFIIEECNPSEVMNVTIWGETFEIICNKYKNVGDKTTTYLLYDTESELVKAVHHTSTKKVPDLQRFKTYFVTLLIHHLDSRVANIVAEKAMDKYGFVIDIHDAFIINPEMVYDVKTWYAEVITAIHRDRESILNEYFRSIGITAKARARWQGILSKVHPFEGHFECSLNALK